MTYICNLIILLFSILLISSKSYSDDKFPLLEGPYLGQKPPGSVPKIFAPGYVSTKHRDHSGFFSPDMKAFYFTRKNVYSEKWSLIRFKLENNRWHPSVMGPRVGRPILSPDGKIMHLGNKYMKRNGDGWSEVKSLGRMFEREDWGIMRLSASAKGTYVFDDYKSNDVLRISTIKNGERQPPRPLTPQINEGKWTAHPFIAPDESYLIWDSEKDDGYGGTDLYISFRQRDDSWGKAINLGATINTSGTEGGAYVSPDGNYLFFNRTSVQVNEERDVEGDIYWVDAQVIWDLKSRQGLIR
ncbi:hypothetical protein [Agaribacter marinus]|uniref:WD40-like Beta Propeller Repeat n=1 Tax=Agaribacter marinus TaxID=1431249 RepID=A0AA37SWB5_9ALTE|nr:hypothetical protein [Agaribacter marinus]GLR69594.1 hypothetical protein GCM10007852_05020 [Agaribacter marinus]